ncbi:HIT family protein [Vagococcus penaei]|uniref:HIT family protein n=1 Tax=Vagococcus penaei TaxID=633807 RepID=A0A1Q2D6N9_9ENTE|nr:HIT family protein [Vagococcus penaei]AQP54089.1 HIT family protein [Vagococcus penaei]RST98497.1 HIT family protein [Vagococcus penaei]
MSDCIFCNIVNREIPSYTVYEDEDVYAFLDITQTTKGHTLVIPKKHVADIFAYDEELSQKVFSRIPKIARALELAFPDMKGLNVINNNKELAYQTVFHSHFHLIPRYDESDGFKLTFTNHADDYSPNDMQEIADLIKRNVTL